MTDTSAFKNNDAHLLLHPKTLHKEKYSQKLILALLNSETFLTIISEDE